jgi:NADH-quinone oxidoreductase subunit J
LLGEIILVVAGWTIGPDAIAVRSSPTPPLEDVTNAEALGRILYTKYVYLFQAAGMVLLVAMIGAIVLTLRHKPGVRRQNIPDQVARTPEDAMEVKKVKPGQGI